MSREGGAGMSRVGEGQACVKWGRGRHVSSGGGAGMCQVGEGPACVEGGRGRHVSVGEGQACVKWGRGRHVSVGEGQACVEWGRVDQWWSVRETLLWQYHVVFPAHTRGGSRVTTLKALCSLCGCSSHAVVH